MKSVMIKIVFALYTLSPIPALIYFSSVPMVYATPLPEKESRGGAMNTSDQATGEQLLTGQQRGLVMEPLPAEASTKNHAYVLKTQSGHWHAPGMVRSSGVR